jgi:FixJ family two-component response regulator
MANKILLVDDEPAVLQGYERLMRREFQLETALGAAQALAMFADHGTYAVVISDMRMPEMDGVQLLSRIKSLSPDTIRIMLTGNADIETAVQAVNEGNIFRFLTKPCNKDVLAKTLTAGIVQYGLVTAEKELLEKTLRGTIQVLTEVLSLVNPAAFSRALRVNRYIAHVVTQLGLGSPWRFEVAALMSQLGCVTLDPETIEAVYGGRELSLQEQARFDAHPKVAADLLARIPRMEPIAWMIAHQHEPGSVEQDFSDREMATTVRLGADILRVTLGFDELLCRGHARSSAMTELVFRYQGVDPRIFQALDELEPEVSPTAVRVCPLDELATGMILHREVRGPNGLLIVAKGQEVTFPLILKLKNFHEKGAIPGAIEVSVPRNLARKLAPATAG